MNENQEIIQDEQLDPEFGVLHPEVEEPVDPEFGQLHPEEEEYLPQPYGVYVEVDSMERVVRLYSNLFEEVTEKSILIDQGFGDAYTHATGNYLPSKDMKPLYNEQGIYIYKLSDDVTPVVSPYGAVLKQIVERTPEEIQADIDAIPAPPKPEIEVVRDRVDTAEMDIMSNTDLIMVNMEATAEAYEAGLINDEMVMISMEALTELDNRIIQLEALVERIISGATVLPE